MMNARTYYKFYSYMTSRMGEANGQFPDSRALSGLLGLELRHLIISNYMNSISKNFFLRYWHFLY